MKGMTLFLSFLAFLLVSVPLAEAEDVHYLGKFIDREGALIWVSGQEYEVSEGTVIPGWGTVKQITDRHLIVQRVLSEEEKEELALQGAAVYDILEIHIPHSDLRLVPVPVP